MEATEGSKSRLVGQINELNFRLDEDPGVSNTFDLPTYDYHTLLSHNIYYNLNSRSKIIVEDGNTSKVGLQQNNVNRIWLFTYISLCYYSNLFFNCPIYFVNAIKSSTLFIKLIPSIHHLLNKSNKIYSINSIKFIIPFQKNSYIIYHLHNQFYWRGTSIVSSIGEEFIQLFSCYEKYIKWSTHFFSLFYPVHEPYYFRKNLR